MKAMLLFLATFLSIGYTIPSSAQNANWDDNIAFKLAVASHCAYEIKRGNSDSINKRGVKKCLEDRAKKTRAETSALDVFLNLQDDAIETYLSGRQTNSQINAAFLVKIDDGTIIAFRGTEPNFSDWQNNFQLADFSLEPYPNGRHKGFEDALSTLSEKITNGQIWRAISSDSEKNLYITGHSKGGALTQGATVDFEVKYGFTGKIVPYAFGAARFFTAQGKEMSLRGSRWLNDLWRFEYQYDPVPHVPLGQITYDTLLRLEKFTRTIAEKSLDSPQDWESRIKENNINFVTVGKLAYVGDDNELDITQRFDNGNSYKNRLIASFKKFVGHPTNSAKFLKEQHNDCYHEFLEIKVTKSNTALSPNCRNDSSR